MFPKVQFAAPYYHKLFLFILFSNINNGMHGDVVFVVLINNPGYIPPYYIEWYKSDLRSSSKGSLSDTQ